MRFILILACICAVSMQIGAQTSQPAGNPANVSKNSPPRIIDFEKVAISDSSGQVFSPEIVKRLLSTGKFFIKWTVPFESGMLVPLSEEQIKEREKRMPKPTESKFFTTGQKFNGFSEKDMNGIKLNIKELVASGKTVVLNFWFVNCPPCRMEMPMLNDLVNGYKDNQDIVFISISLDEKFSIKEFLKSNPFNYHIIDNGRYIAAKYGITSYPTHVVLSKKGNVIFHTTGFANNTVSWVKKSIEASLHDGLPE